jgi:hypothetical protein
MLKISTKNYKINKNSAKKAINKNKRNSNPNKFLVKNKKKNIQKTLNHLITPRKQNQIH